MLYRKVCQLNAVKKTRHSYCSAFICHLAEPATLYNWLDYVIAEILNDLKLDKPDRFDLAINEQQPSPYTSKKIRTMRDMLTVLLAERTLLSVAVRTTSTYQCNIVYPLALGDADTLYREQFSFKSEDASEENIRQFTGHIVDHNGLKKWLKRIESKRAYTVRVNGESPAYNLSGGSVKKTLRDRAASRGLFSIELEKGQKLETCSVVYRENFSEVAFAEDPARSLIEDLRLSVLMPAKAQARRGSTSVTLMDSGETCGRSIWDWWSLFENAGMHLESVLTRLAYEEIGSEWKLEYHTWSSFLHGGRYYCLVKKPSRR